MDEKVAETARRGITYMKEKHGSFCREYKSATRIIMNTEREMIRMGQLMVSKLRVTTYNFNIYRAKSQLKLKIVSKSMSR